MGVIEYIRSGLARRSLKRQGIKLTHGIRSIPRNATLVLEEGVSIHCEKMRFDELRIGAMTYVRSGSELLNVRQIGRFCSIGNHAVIGQSRGGPGHPLDWVSTHPFQLGTGVSDDEGYDASGTTIGNDVWIGRDAMIMEGVSVGTGAIVATRSLVTRDVPPYAIVAGTPAKVIRYRHAPELAERLLASRWWEIDLTMLKRLPLDNPQIFLQSLDNVVPANYKTYLLTRSHWRLA